MTGEPALVRRLGTADAVMIGLGSMLGAGVFSVFAPAAGAAGAGLLVGLAVAAVVAYCNATASAQLAAQYPTSGGTYVYGRARLGAWPGYLAGWGFVIGKTASCAAMALTFAAYAVPAPWQRPAAVAAVLAVAAVNYRGITRTAQLTRLIVTVVLLVLAISVVVGLHGGRPDPALLLDGPGPAGIYGVLQSAGLLFFAFAGYARIATMGDEVRDPERTIPRAILLALGGAVVVYAAVAVTALLTLGPDRLAGSTAPLIDVVTAAAGGRWAVPIVAAGGTAAALGALLALMAGIGRTTLAMAREGDLPRGLAAVHPEFRVPHRADVVLAVVVTVLVVTIDLRSAIAFSSFGVLFYYFVANVAAFTQHPPQRRFPRPLQVLGAGGCLLLVATLPWQAIAIGCGVFLVGIAHRGLRLIAARRRLGNGRWPARREPRR